MNIHDTKSGCHVYQAAKQKFDQLKEYVQTPVIEELLLNLLKQNTEKTLKFQKKSNRKNGKFCRKDGAFTFAWLNHSRRLSKDYEISISSAENMVMISHIHTLLKRY